LAVITLVTVKLHPIPEHVVATVCVFDSLTDAAQAVAAIKLAEITKISTICRKTWGLYKKPPLPFAIVEANGYRFGVRPAPKGRCGLHSALTLVAVRCTSATVLWMPWEVRSDGGDRLGGAEFDAAVAQFLLDHRSRWQWYCTPCNYATLKHLANEMPFIVDVKDKLSASRRRMTEIMSRGVPSGMGLLAVGDSVWNWFSKSGGNKYAVQEHDSDDRSSNE
jgi:FAD/FMN-containing dehydrogenase